MLETEYSIKQEQLYNVIADGTDAEIEKEIDELEEGLSLICINDEF